MSFGVLLISSKEMARLAVLRVETVLASDTMMKKLSSPRPSYFWNQAPVASDILASILLLNHVVVSMKAMVCPGFSLSWWRAWWNLRYPLGIGTVV